MGTGNRRYRGLECGFIITVWPPPNRYGLNNPIAPPKINGEEIKAKVESQFYRVKADLNSELSEDDKNSIRYATQSFINYGKDFCGKYQNKETHKTLNRLKRDDSIRVCKFDKGNGVVILDAVDYYEKLDQIVFDDTKFKEIKIKDDLDIHHPVIKKENSISRFLTKYVKPFIPEKTFDRICPTGSQPGKIYGLCKVHKDGLPLRPVVSMVNTSEYEIAKFLDELIKPNIPDKYMLNSTSNFMDKLKSFGFSKTDKLVSFDVKSLFTSIPLNETIDIVSDCMYDENSKNIPPFPKSTFKKLLEYATGGYFLYKDQLYTQIDGVSMGSPLGPTLSNFFMAYIENKLLSAESDLNPRIYFRYVDDIFCVFDSHVDQSTFLDSLNNLHPNIEFTCEVGPQKLAFLDCMITLPEGDNLPVSTEVYRKSTNTNVLLNYNALCPIKWKLGLMTCLINRAYTVCSSWELFHNELEKLKDIFSSNGYPVNLFWETVNKFVTKKFDDNSSKEKDDMKYVLCLPYIGHASLDFRKKLIKLYRRLGVNVCVVFKAFKVGNYFSLKSKTPHALKANVVYEFVCSCDTSLSYIGKTKRHLAIRVDEHCTGTKNSAIQTHRQLCTCSPDINDFKIVCSGKSDLDIKIKEALYIKKRKPKLNRQLYQNGSNFVLNIF